MTVDEAIRLSKNKLRRSVQCECPDCQAQAVLLAEVERLQVSNSRWAREFATQAALTERAVLAGEESVQQFKALERAYAQRGFKP